MKANRFALHRTIAALLAILLISAACVAPAEFEGQANGTAAVLHARVVLAADPVRMEMARDAPVVGLLFHGMRLPITGRNMTCEWLKVKLPPSLSHFGAEGWIVGPPEFALIEGGGCADIPLLMPVPTPAG